MLTPSTPHLSTCRFAKIKEVGVELPIRIDVRGRELAAGERHSMCGIAGFTGTPQADVLRRMAAALRHRGPDDFGLWMNERASLANTRLAVMDPLHGAQPVASEDGHILVVYNGEIYNAPELRERLLARGHLIRTRCDTELLPHLYEEHGPDFVDELEGEFAIAIWDNARRRLLLSRDRLGIKPLYYACVGGRLVFASELAGLTPWLGRRPTIDRQAVAHYLSLRHVPAPYTIYEKARALRPGEQLEFTDEPRGRRYWRLEEQAGQPPDMDLTNEPAVIDELERRLLDSVRRRLAADAPVGVLLSGGVDSSLLLAMATRCATAPLDAFTLIYDETFAGKQADAQAARQVAELFGARRHERLLTSTEFEKATPRIAKAFGEPFAGVSSGYFLNSLVADRVKVVLSGDGADEQFGSYRAHRLAQPVDRLNRFGMERLLHEPALAGCFAGKLDELAEFRGLADWQWRARLLAFTDEEKAELLTEGDFARSDALLRDTLARCGRDPQNRQQLLDCMTLLPDQVLTFNDRLSMCHSLETRVPYLDHTLVEFVSRLPGDLKIRSGVCKWALKEVARRWLPSQIVERPKEGFVAPVNAWQRGSLRPLIERTLAPERIAAHGLFREGTVTRLVDAYYAGADALQYKVWTVFCFQTWHDHVYLSSAPRLEPSRTPSLLHA